MNAPALHDFESALLDLDAALRPITRRPPVSDRFRQLQTAHQRFLAAIASFRLQILMAAAHVSPPKTADDAVALVGRAIDLAVQAGVPHLEIAALFNRKTIGGE